MTLDDLKRLPQWICWRYEKNDVGKLEKRPIIPDTGGIHASSTKANTWKSYQEAASDAKNSGYDGVGFVLSQNGKGILFDFDHCVEDGKITNSWVQSLVDRLDSYTELSPSGTGVHVLVQGDLPNDGKGISKIVDGQHIEIYTRGRFMTMTEKPYGALKPIRTAQKEIDSIIGEINPEPERERSTKPTQTNTLPQFSGDDAMVLDALQSINCASCSYNDWLRIGTALKTEGFDFDVWDSWSRSDERYNGSEMLRKWNSLQIDEVHAGTIIEIAKASGWRPQTQSQSKKSKCLNWDDYIQFDGYDDSTDKEPAPVLTKSESVGEEPSGDQAEETPKPKLLKAADIPFTPPRWLIKPYLQRGKGCLIQADNGMGKTALICGIAAHISTGTPILDTPVEMQGDVVILSVEDDLPVLRGRIEACGGDLNHCFFIGDGAGLTFNDPFIEEAVKQVQAKLLIFDPLQCFLGAKVDMFRANETRPQLAKLFEMCDRNDCACLIVAHTAKNASEKSAVNRSLGSVDIPAAMRSILQVVQNPENPDERIAVHVKSSNAYRGKSLRYKIGEYGGIEFLGYSDLDVDDVERIVREQKRKAEKLPYDKEPLVEMFLQLITDHPAGGFWSYADLKDEGIKILGREPFSSNKQLRDKLDLGLSTELLDNDGIKVIHGVKGKGNVAGVRIESYRVPKAYQTHIETNTSPDS